RYTDFQDLLSDMESVLADLRAGRAASLADTARKLLAEGDYDQAMVAVRESLQLNPSGLSVRELLAAIRRKIRDLQPAAPEQTLILTSSPTQLFPAASQNA